MTLAARKEVSSGRARVSPACRAAQQGRPRNRRTGADEQMVYSLAITPEAIWGHPLRLLPCSLIWSAAQSTHGTGRLSWMPGWRRDGDGVVCVLACGDQSQNLRKAGKLLAASYRVGGLEEPNATRRGTNASEPPSRYILISTGKWPDASAKIQTTHDTSESRPSLANGAIVFVVDR